jgi:DNA-binding CsgD family transcriptional regulator
LLLRAKVLRGLGDVEGALDLVLRCGRELDETGLHDPIFAPWWLHAALLLAELGRPAEAVEPVLRGEALAARWDTAEARGLALLARGVITPGRTGLELLDGAVTELAGSPVRLAHVRALSCLGGAQAAAGDLKSARGQLRTAVDLAVRCGDLVAANEARCLLKRAGGRMPQSSTGRVDALTGGERRVAALAASGLSNKEIAEALFVTVRTVESHLSNTYRKLGVQVRTDLVGELGRR